VTGVDASADLLGRFERDLAAEPAAVRDRVRVERGLIEDYPERAGWSRFPVVLCHGVLMYAEDPAPVLRAIAALAAPGGAVSLLAALLDCEERAGRTDPYRQVAALLHVIARKGA
jgi:S-adenosylmethionine-dependent methyltransferase